MWVPDDAFQLRLFLSGHCVRVHIQVNSWMEMTIFAANTPVDENVTRSVVMQVRNFPPGGMFDKGSVERTLKVFAEDARIVQDLSPNYLPESLETEVSVEQDKFMGAWRKVRKVHKPLASGQRLIPKLLPRTMCCL